MSLRGVCAPGTTTTTSALVGTLREDPELARGVPRAGPAPAMTRSLRFTGVCTHAPTFTGVCTYAPTFTGVCTQISAPARRVVVQTPVNPGGNVRTPVNPAGTCGRR